MKLNTICIAMMAALVTYAQALPRYEGEEALAEAVAEALVMEDQAMFEDQTFPEIGDDAQRRIRYDFHLGAGGAADGRSIDGTCKECCGNLAQRY
ncbi:hypothetical protein FQN51_007829 [Onygenales sp. PD_10]|nr:hypothetical protein FQN51_007829 [Onygenales sp. PD_10]